MTLQLSADPERPFKLADLSRLVAHEFHHTWVHARYAPPDALRFFNEGFTDYYAFLVSARLGIIGWDRFGTELAERIDRLAANPLAGQMSLVEAGGPIFFESEEAGDLVYHGGTVLAALLDRHLRAAGDSLGLDGFMRGFNNDPRWGWEHAPGLSDLVAAVASAAGDAYADTLRTRVTTPWSLDPVAAFAAEGVGVTRQGAPGAECFRLDASPWQDDAVPAEEEHVRAAVDSL
jgi:predicted metalloprotease with PDZ domain